MVVIKVVVVVVVGRNVVVLVVGVVVVVTVVVVMRLKDELRKVYVMVALEIAEFNVFEFKGVVVL